MEHYPDNYTDMLSMVCFRELAFENCSVLSFSEWQHRLKDRLYDLLGLNQIEQRPRSKLISRPLLQIDKGDYTMQEFVINTEPGVAIPFYVLKPKGVFTKHPLVITPHGHGRNARDNYVGICHNAQEEKEVLEGERDIALQAVKQGYIVYAPLMRGFGSLRLPEDEHADEPYSDRKLQMRALLFGRTLLGERVWDIMRLIDFACCQDDIDCSRIAITGNSGGGTVSLYAAACDERIALAAPSSCFCSFSESIGKIRHCECNYIPGILKTAELHDIAGLICPRPVLMVAGKDDNIFPLHGVQSSFQQLQAIYKVGKEPENCRLFIGSGGHRYFSEPVWKFVTEFFTSHEHK